ncbi:MAG TPA: NADPH-dependent glutamate synthase [Spirochaetota bacterium]|nr:NADPH-dependent glutamate synthase [Spirochaetota bacterium]
MSDRFKAIHMKEQPAEERKKNFLEVPCGYTEEEAVLEANRCLQCKNAPCIEGCPVSIDIRSFIGHIQKREFDKAVNKIYEADILPCVTGRVCPQESQCQAKCVLNNKGDAVSIGSLERYVADRDLERRREALKGEPVKISGKTKVAVIGSGPAGIACAADLGKYGYDVTIFEAFHKAGGVLVYGIPEFRLPKDIVDVEIRSLVQTGVKLVTNVLTGRSFTIDELMAEGYKAVFVGSGAGLPQFMKLPGENLNNVYSANEFLTRVNLMKAHRYPEYDTPVKYGKNCAVIGGGNVALDVARTALRLGSENVYLIYRRTQEEMPARLEEVRHALEEGIQLLALTNPVAYHGDEAGFLQKIECVKMELGEPDESGRRRPVLVEGSNFFIEADVCVVSIGSTPNPLIAMTSPLIETTKWGTIKVDEKGMTTMPGVFAGGDIVTGAATVITAMGAGRTAAASMHEYLQNKKD